MLQKINKSKTPTWNKYCGFVRSFMLIKCNKDEG